MARRLALRLLQMVITLWVFVTIVFFMLHASPVDITQRFVGDPSIPLEHRQLIIERFGLDRPLGEQYVRYVANVARGDFGVSFLFYPRTVMEVLVARLPRTVLLFTTATLLSYWLGFVVGKVVAWRRGGTLEYSATIVSVLLYTVFLPWFALVMIWLLAFVVPLFPIRGFLSPLLWRDAPLTANQVLHLMLLSATAAVAALVAVRAFASRIASRATRAITTAGGAALVLGAFAAFWALHPARPLAANIAHHAILPTLTLTLVAFGGTMLLTRSSMLETMQEDYVLTARAKGLAEGVVRDRHAARNALLPVVTSLTLSIAFILGGGVVTEAVFSWPGMGDALLQAAVGGDIPLALGALTLTGAVALVAHLAADVLHGYLDPRLRG